MDPKHDSGHGPNPADDSPSHPGPPAPVRRATGWVPAQRLAVLIASAPLILLLGAALAIEWRPSRGAALWLIQGEGHPVELLTFLFLWLAGLMSLALVRRRASSPALVRGFLLAFGLGMLVVGLEEIAWGQVFFDFETPGSLRDMNYKGELSLHNIEGLGSVSEILRLAFGLGGLIGLLASVLRPLQPIAVPLVLAPWFALIALHGAADLYVEAYSRGSPLHQLINQTSELVEMLIGLAGLLYVWLLGRRGPLIG